MSETLAALPPEWIDLAADIRSVDGNHDLGAGALAEALTRRGWTRRGVRVGDDGLDSVYRERNAVVAALIRTNGWPASLMAAPDADGWWIVYAETPQGQVSWHVHPTDVRLFDDVPRRGADWDGHDTDTKYERVASLVRVGDEGHDCPIADALRDLLDFMPATMGWQLNAAVDRANEALGRIAATPTPPEIDVEAAPRCGVHTFVTTDVCGCKS